jgi:hypothetical protein
MADYEIPEPEPKEIDEKPAIELRHLADNAVLKAQPQQGNEKRENCPTTSRTRPRSRTAGTRSSGSSSAPTGGASGGRPYQKTRP